MLCRQLCSTHAFMISNALSVVPWLMVWHLVPCWMGALGEDRRGFPSTNAERFTSTDNIELQTEKADKMGK